MASTWQVVRGFPGSGKTEHGLSLVQSTFAAVGAGGGSSSSIMTKGGGRGPSRFAVIVGASRHDKEALRLRTMLWPKGHVHNCHSLCLAWFGLGRSDREFEMATRFLVQQAQPPSPPEQQRHEYDGSDLVESGLPSTRAGGRRQPGRYPSHAKELLLVLDNVDQWYPLIWHFLCALIHFARMHHRQRLAVVCLTSPWWSAPPSIVAFLHHQNIVTLDVVHLAGSKWLPFGIAYFIVHDLLAPLPPQHNEEAQHAATWSSIKACATTTTTVFLGVVAEPMTSSTNGGPLPTMTPPTSSSSPHAPHSELIVRWPHSSCSSSSSMHQQQTASDRSARSVVITSANEWRSVQRLFRNVVVYNADLIPVKLLAEILSHCTGGATLHCFCNNQTNNTPLRPTTVIHPVIGGGSIGVVELLRRISSVQAHQDDGNIVPEQLVSKYIKVVQVHRLGLYGLTTADMALLLDRSCGLFSGQLLGRVLPLLLQMKLANILPIDLKQVVSKCSLDCGISPSSASAALLLSREQGMMHLLECLVVGLENTILALWHHSRANRATATPSETTPLLSPLAQSHVRFEKEVHREWSAQDTFNTGRRTEAIVHGRVDLSLGHAHHNDVLVEFKCKRRPLQAVDVLQCMLYQVMCPHQHVLLLDVLRGQALELAFVVGITHKAFFEAVVEQGLCMRQGEP